MNVSVYISEFFSCVICLCECNKHKWSMNNMWLFFPFSLYCLALYFLTLPKSKKVTISLPPSSLFLFFFLLFRTGLAVNLLGLLCYINQFYLVQLMCESRPFISMRKDISLYSIVNQILYWPYGFLPLPSRHMRNTFPKVLIIICHLIEARDLKHPYGLGSCTLKTRWKSSQKIAELLLLIKTRSEGQFLSLSI